MSVDNLESTTTTTSTAPPIAVYLYAGDQIIENATTGYLYFQDSLGNTSHVTDAAGNLLERYTYSAFGTPSFFSTNNTQLSASAYGIRHLFQGQLWTQETGLNDYRNRIELPAMGVFLQPDPIGFKGDAANLYRFCGNDAVNRTDPTGLYPVIDLTNASELRNTITGCFLTPESEADASAQAASTTALPLASEQAAATSRANVSSRRDMAGVAEDDVRSTKYHNTGFFHTVNHCNDLIHDAAEASGRTPPMVWVPGFPEGFWRPAVSHELADPNVKIPHWTNPRPLSEARRNDIIAQQHGKWEHTGIITGPGSSISVNTDRRGVVEPGDWGFRPFPRNGEHPGDPAPVVRHYISGSAGDW